ncbi:MAG: ChaN family lipoprotein [Crocinitomicaceae bacterium]|jgi:uncharacterized iron-regulated protein|nr:ChaN family lipoprotein [Crocinitomicaceae bacterium]MDG1657136.1 ChaN family lipoprotein [Crocinitomicaceae bacterium]MDG2440570.1 ChaN family lipoprotein [Crocinitomicaceae bacterium]
MRILSLFCSLLLVSTSIGQSKPAYKIYNAKGKAVSYKKMIKKLEKSDIILFGENHNNAIAHWLQLEVTTDLHKIRKLSLGAEMIEQDNQDELNDYLEGLIDQRAFDTLARLWPNHATDYAPLVNFAKENNLPFIATNIPRRYANLVYKKGFDALDTLSAEEKSWIAPLPITFDPALPQYVHILEMMGSHGTPELVMAQAIKDATMAHFINAQHNEGDLFLHYNGAFHSNRYEGILWYLMQSNPGREYTTLSTVDQANVNQLEKDNKGLADFIICVDENMTSTY